MKANNTPEVIESIELSKLHPFPDLSLIHI